MAASTARHETRALLRAHLAAVSGYRHLTQHCPVCHRLLRLAMDAMDTVDAMDAMDAMDTVDAMDARGAVDTVDAMDARDAFEPIERAERSAEGDASTRPPGM
ncbi:DUF6274 family protein [Streptomyces sp. NPDC001514]